MCGRFALTLPNDAIAQLFAAQPANDLPQGPNYNICPTTPVHVVSAGEGIRRLQAMRWGFLPHWYKTETAGPLLINARAETLAEKPAFAEACRKRRCLIPASGFYEWPRASRGRRLPWYIRRCDDAPLAFAGIWQDWRQHSGQNGGQDCGQHDSQATCAIVTTAANQSFLPIHHRMPLMLEPQDWSLWLGESGKGAASLMQPGPEGLHLMHRVAMDVNSSGPADPR
ncbi:SOS response-associated peptidase [Pseudophaeobacter leonis]|uniref:SOS response-associated peptidase n=1 Tax=Pseudophaeobacter leonis TaxID=1144477 RepID=UPI0030C707F1